MSPLTANLRHLYQRKGLWLFYTLIPLMMLPMVHMMVSHVRRTGDVGRGIFAYPLLIAFLSGTFIANHVVDLLACPFSFCLPDHQRAARRFLVIVGAVVSVLSAMVFMVYPGQDWPVRLTAVAAAACATFACFWLATVTAAPRTVGRGVPGLAGLWVWLLVLVGLYYDLHTALVDAIFAGRLSLFAACLLIVVLAWSKWGSRDLARQFCGILRATGFDIGDVERVRRMSQMRWAAKGTRVGLFERSTERFFLSRVTGHHALGAARVVWGGLYATFGGIGTTGPGRILIGALIMALYFGYLGSQMSWFVFVFISIMAGWWMQHPVYSVMSVPQGRRERFLVGIGASLMGCVIAACVLGVGLLITCLAVPIAPPIPVKSAVIQFQVMQPWGLWVPWAILPTVQVIRLIWPRRWWIGMIVCLAFAPIVSITAGSPDLLHLWTLPVIAGMIIASWCVFVAVLRWVCFRRDLVIQ